MTTKLAEFMTKATPAQREVVAYQAGTTVAYLWQLAGRHRRRCNVAIAVGIELATKKLNAMTHGALPIVTTYDMAAMGEEGGAEV